MYLCLCRSVSDRTARSLVKEGVCSVPELMRRTGAGTGCGACVEELARCVAREQSQAAEVRSAK